VTPTPTSAPGCEFCNAPGGAVLWQNDLCRVVRVDEPDYPGFCRVILKRHAREMTDLAPDERAALMAVVYAVEDALRETMRPDKMNIASLGNMTPHLHWHVVPRFRDDRHFPGPIWAQPQRESSVPAERVARAAGLAAALLARLGA
jgi:diadenosine tetraphosphate (Ap4A) HIT family hydrolase